MPHPLCAVIRTEVQEHVSGALDEGATSVGDLWRRFGGSPVRFDDSYVFSNLNSPEDVDVWFGEHAHSQQLSGFVDGNR
jgi:molybdopterin-guanine dinucleotide biosynthesis protein A